ncbi:MAG: T9SS type A sorting domain-containing protein [bacterium]|nr:T9SS type A sorting domain-containing protein [bacterium]
MNMLGKGIVIIFLVLVMALVLSTIKSESQQEKGGVCCNNLFPSINNDPEERASMHCDGEPYYTNCYTCALYWSAYVDVDDDLDEPIELCDFLPYGEVPPLPIVHIPDSFEVLINGDDHPEISWTPYYVHEYQIYRKKDNNSWYKIASITKFKNSSFVDSKITLPDGHTYRYKMRGKIYDTYSDFSQEKIPGARWLPKNFSEKKSENYSLKQGIELSKNYPNPFIASTDICFELCEAAHVKLEIYNLLGQKIRSMIDAKKTPGYYSVNWDGKNYAGVSVCSGIYLYILTADGLSKIHKMVVLD